MKSQSFKTIKKFASRFCASRRGRLRRMLLAAFFTGGSLAAATTSAMAADAPPVHLGGISILVHEFIPEATVAVIASEERGDVVAATPIHRTSSQFNQSIAAAVSDSAAKIGIPVEQFLEPFVMVGHPGSPSRDSSPYPSRLIESAPLATTSPEKSPAADMETELAAVAPPQQQVDDVAALNCWWLGEDALEWTAEVIDIDDIFAMGAADANELAVNDVVSGVGSAPLIATIPDAYFPYDIAPRDIELDYLSLTTVQPIRPKNYVSLPEQCDRDEANEVALTEPVIEISPDCLLDELIHDAAEFSKQNHLGDLSLATLGETVGNWFALSTDGSARREKPASNSSDGRNRLATLSVDDSADHESDEQFAIHPVDKETLPGDTADDAAVEVAPEQVVADGTETPTVDDVALAEIVAMEVGSEQIPAPVAEEAPNAVAAEQVVVDETEAPAVEEVAVEEVAVEEVAVAEVVTMEIDGEQIPAPVAEEASNAVTAEQVVADDTEAPTVEDVALAEIIAMEVGSEPIPALVAEEASNAVTPEQVVADETGAPAVEEVALAEVVTMEIDGEPIPAPVADEAPNAVTTEQVATEETEAPASVEIAVADIVTINVDDEENATPVVDEALETGNAEQLVSNDAVAPETTSTTAAELTLIAPVEAFSLSQVIDTINQWQQYAMAKILAPRDASELPATEIAEKADTSNESVIR